MYLDRSPQVELGLVQLWAKDSGLMSLVLQNEMNLHKSVGKAKRYDNIYFKVIGFESRMPVS